MDKRTCYTVRISKHPGAGQAHPQAETPAINQSSNVHPQEPLLITPTNVVGQQVCEAKINHCVSD